MCYIRYIIICWYSKAPNFQISWNFWNPISTIYTICFDPTNSQSRILSEYIWGTSHIPARTEESPTNWRWYFTDNKIKCQWVSYDYCLITQNLNKIVFKKYGCRKECKKNWKCKKVEMMKCLPTCKCRGKKQKE